MTTQQQSESGSQSGPLLGTRGAIQQWSQTLIPTSREAPGDAQMPSHALLHRAGYIRRVTAGVYEYLPLGWRVLRKVSEIIRQEMDAAGASELLMPAFVPIEFYKDTKRDEAYGDLLFKLTDRHGRETALGPTHEETITDLMMGALTSYKQLPLTLYQIQTKYRDEFRPRAGLLRGREFLMKDAYSFHIELEGPGGLDEVYDRLKIAYENIFTRCGLDFSVVEAESGPIGGSASHEFMVNCESGEDTILVCPETGYAANVEKCEIGSRGFDFGAAGGEPAKHNTPNQPGIDLVAETLGTTPAGMLKTIVMRTDEAEPRWVLAVVRGDHDVNEGKVRDAVGAAVELAPEGEAKAAGFAIGYVSPEMASRVANVVIVVDADAAQPGPWATGADEKDHHVTGWTWAKAFGDLPAAGEVGPNNPLVEGSVKVADIRNAMAGDPSPRAAGAALAAKRGIEVGHIFKLGDKYSQAMGLKVLDKAQQKRIPLMGCYGIGVSRTVAACVEMSHDDDGIIWPAAIAPFQVLITIMKKGDEAQEAAAERLSSALSERGIDVLVDDRDERAGVKFKDGDLIGIPVRITLGNKALEQNSVEFKRRGDEGKGDLVELDAVVMTVEASLR